MQLFLLVVLFLFTASFSYAQTQQPQAWLIYFGHTKIKDSKWGIHHELQLRDYQIIGDHNQTLARVGAQYQFKPYLQGTLGYGFVYTEAMGAPNNPFNEHRIYQEIMASHGIKTAKLRHRFRLEERFIENQDFRGRFRYNLFVDVPLTKYGFSAKGSYLAFYDEVFINLSDNSNIKAFDRNRAYAGLGYKVKNNLGIQLGYMRQHVGTAKGTNHILLSTHHQIHWK